jgi:hypothetical protein
MVTFIILRLLDIWSTLLSVSTFGIDLETNPVSRFLLEKGLFVWWQIFLTSIVCLFLVKFDSRAVRIGLKVFNVVTTVVVLVNFISYFLATGIL